MRSSSGSHTGPRRSQQRSPPASERHEFALILAACVGSICQPKLSMPTRRATLGRHRSMSWLTANRRCLSRLQGHTHGRRGVFAQRLQEGPSARA